MKTRKVKALYDEVINLQNKKQLSESIEERLEKTLKEYADRLTSLSESVLTNKQTTLFKEINK